MQKLFYSSLVYFLFLLASCEGPQNFHYVLIDADKHLPIDSVHICAQLKRADKIYTCVDAWSNEKGIMDASPMIGTGLSLQHPEFKISFLKKKYKTIVLENVFKDTVYLSRVGETIP